MSSDFNHSTQGGFITGFPFMFIWQPLAFVLFGIGAVLGALPDMLTLFGVNKDDTHLGWIDKKMKWIPAWWLHTWQDRFWHSYPHHHPVKDWGEVLSIIVSIGLLYLMFVVHIPSTF